MMLIYAVLRWSNEPRSCGAIESLDLLSKLGQAQSRVGSPSGDIVKRRRRYQASFELAKWRLVGVPAGALPKRNVVQKVEWQTESAG